jgi:hypothetical protein
MTFAYTIDKQTVFGDMRKAFISFTGAVLGTAGNAVITGFRIIKGVTLTLTGTGSITDAPTVAVSGGTVTIYAATSTAGYLEVSGY